MQHPHILRRQNINQHPCIHIPNLNKIRFKRQDIRLEYRKRLRVPLPRNLPLWEGAPTVAVDKEGEVRVAEQEITVDALDVDGADVFFEGDEVERGVGLVEERLGH